MIKHGIFVFVVFFCISQSETMNILAKETMKTFGKLIEFSAPEKEPEHEPESEKEPEHEPEPEKVKLKLEFPDGYPQISNDEIEQLYISLFYHRIDELDEAILCNINLWINECEPNTLLNNALTSTKKVLNIILILNLDFRMAVLFHLNY